MCPELRSFIQTLLDLLQRAEDYIRDKVDLTFFTQTLPQLVEHIYNTAFAHTRERRDLSHGLGLIAELLGDGVESEDQKIPAFFRNLGPSVNDWEKYLQSLAEGQPSGTESPIDRPEEHLFLQKDDLLVHQLVGEYESIISSLRTKLDSRAPPPVLNLDVSVLKEDDNISPSSRSTSSEKKESWLIVSALIKEIQKVQLQKPEVTQNVSSQTSASADISTAISQASDEDTTLAENRKLLNPSSIPEVHPGGSSQKAISTSLQRKYRSLLRKRQTLIGKVCPAVRESIQKVTQVQDSYQWVLNIPNRNLRMSFQEVLVDLSSKNERGLYEARVRAVVGGRSLTFYSLVGLENESFYRSVPRIISVALEGLKA